jgi:hypothetical protein
VESKTGGSERFQGAGRGWIGLTRLWKCVEKPRGRSVFAVDTETLKAKTQRVNKGLQNAESRPLQPTRLDWLPRVCWLARSRKLDYAGPVASGVSPPLTRYLSFQLRIKFW